jgi:membrane protein
MFPEDFSQTPMTFPFSTFRRNDKSLWKFGGLTFWELVRIVIREIQVHELFERASGLAFDFLLALFPLFFILLAGFGLFAAYSLQLRTDLLAYFADLLPTMAFQLLNRTTGELAASTSREKLTIGIVLALWLVSGGVSSIISSLNAAFRIKESRSWLKVKAIALALALVISILILWAMCIVLVSGDFVDWIGKELQLASVMIVLWKALQWPTALLFVIFAYALIYNFGPDRKGERWHWITPGSVFAALLWLTASVGFRFYLRFVNNYTVIFGSLGAAIILLVWLYATGLAFLIGGEINANIERAAAENANQ